MTELTRDTTGADLLAAAAAGALASIERTLRRGEATPLHVHAEDEAYHVVEGELELRVGAETLWLGAGESYVAPAGVPHAHRAGSASVRVRTAAIVASAARYEDFARAVARPHEGTPTAEEQATLAAIAAANDIVVLAAPGAAAA